MIEVRSQAEALAAINSGETEIHVFADVQISIGGDKTITVVARSRAIVYIESRDSSTLKAESRESSTLKAVSRESSTLKAVSWGSSTLKAVSRESSTLTAVSWESSTLTAVSRGSSTLKAVSWDSSTLKAESRESSTLKAVSRESSTLTAESWESSTLTAESRGSSTAQVRAYAWSMLSLNGAIQVTATAAVRIRIDGGNPEIEGGVVHRVIPPKTPAQWCELYGVTVENDVAILYKAVSDDFKSAYGFDYTPGTVPVAPDWDGGKRECGGGLHFVSTPRGGLRYCDSATRYVACPVALADISVHENPEYPDKIKARRCCAAVWECNEDGERVDAAIPGRLATPMRGLTWKPKPAS